MRGKDAVTCTMVMERAKYLVIKGVRNCLHCYGLHNISVS